MEELTVIKEITQAEKNAYSVLKELGLSSVTIPHEIDDMVLKMQRGIHPERLGLDFPELYRQALSPLYSYTYESYSPGLYSFMRTDVPTDERPYLQYLRTAVHLTYQNTKTKITDTIIPLCDESIDVFMQASSTLEEVYFPKHVLLHGDLFIGNILLCDESYRLIDWEYLRLGPKELELAFCLCWDFITHVELCRYSSYVIMRDINALVSEGCIHNTSKEAILKIFIPMIVALSAMYASQVMYDDSSDVLVGLSAFWPKYHKEVLNHG